MQFLNLSSETPRLIESEIVQIHWLAGGPGDRFENPCSSVQIK